MSKDPEITVILSAYKRIDNLSKQINAINYQTIKPKKILIWQNEGGGQIPKELFSKAYISVNNFNYGVWARFAFALNATTEYICIFDDDTIPGKKWLENCIKTMSINEGLLGTRGVKFKSKNRISPYSEYGWANPNISTKKVDIVGHSWFFKREWLSTFWRELPPLSSSHIAGEDMHFSYTLQKYLNLNTFVPPHPPKDLELWGSQPQLALKLGNDNKGISTMDDSVLRFNKAIKYYTQNGFQLCEFKDKNTKHEIIIGSGLSSNIKIKKLIKKYSWLYKLAIKINTNLKKKGIHL